MIYRLLAFSLCLQYAWACIPVRPGEDMPCPAVPKSATIDETKYLNKGLDGPTNTAGSMVYGCTGDDILLEVVDGMYKELFAGDTIECKPKSGQFTYKDMAVGSKKYICGEKIVPCPTFPEATELGAGVDAVMPPEKTMNNGDTIWMCPSSHSLYAQQGTNNERLKEGDFVICEKQTGKLQVSRSGVKSDVDINVFKFACGQVPCQKCDQSKLLDPTAACTAQNDLYCLSKPTKTDDPITACPIVSCGAESMYQLLTTSTYQLVPDTTMVMCDAGVWKVGGTAITSMGFVCAAEAKCDAKCNMAIAPAIDTGDRGADDVEMTVVPSKPLCTYTCGSGYRMFVNSEEHTSAVCNMMEGVLRLDGETGPVLDGSNKFKCTACECDPGAMFFTTGDSFCEFGSICVAPKEDMMDECKATCAGTSTPRYLNRDGVPMNTDSIECAAPLFMDWIEEGTMQVTCQYPPGDGMATMQPAKGPDYMCDPISTSPTICNGRTCTPENIRYIITPPDEYTVTCFEGLLISDAQPDGGMVMCSASGTMFGTSGLVNCVTDDSPVAACKTSTTVAFTHECKLNVCRLQCADSTQKFNTELGQLQYLKCEQGEIQTMDGIFVDPAALMCV